MSRTSQQKPRLLDSRIIEGFERRLADQGGLSKPADFYKELIETRAIGRELIAHINALEQQSEPALLTPPPGRNHA